MRLSGSLTPSDRADEKPPVGRNVPAGYDTTATIPPESRRPAMRTVASRARGAEDARDLLEHLGLIDPLTPKAQWKRANTPKAES